MYSPGRWQYLSELIIPWIFRFPSVTRVIRCLEHLRELDRYCWNAVYSAFSRSIQKMVSSHDVMTVASRLDEINTTQIRFLTGLRAPDSLAVKRVYCEVNKRHYYCQVSLPPFLSETSFIAMNRSYSIQCIPGPRFPRISNWMIQLQVLCITSPSLRSTTTVFSYSTFLLVMSSEQMVICHSLGLAWYSTY